MFKSSFKQWQVDRNIIDACAAINMFLSTKVKTIGLLQLILPNGWYISKTENKVKWVERQLQISQLDLVNVYNTIRNNKIHIYQYYPNERDNTFIIVRLNVIIDINDRIVLLD